MTSILTNIPTCRIRTQSRSAWTDAFIALLVCSSHPYVSTHIACAPPTPTLIFGHASPVLSFDQPGSSSAPFYSTTTSQASTTYDSFQQASGHLGNISSSLRPAHRLPVRRTSATPKRQAEKRRREAKICYCELCPRYKSDGSFSQYEASTRRETLARHFRTEHDANASRFRCSMCTFYHHRFDKIVRHIRANHPDFEYPIVVRHLVEEVHLQPADAAEELDFTLYPN